MTPPFDKYDFGGKWRHCVLFLNMIICFLNSFDLNVYKPTCDYAASCTSTPLFISVLMVYTFILQVSRYAPYSVPQMRNIKGTLISLEEAFIYKQDFTLHYTTTGGVCSRSCTTNHRYTLALFYRLVRTLRQCMILQFLLNVGTWSDRKLFAIQYKA